MRITKKIAKKTIDYHLEKAQSALDEAYDNKEFANETRSKALAFSGEILMSHVMNHILRSNGIKAEAVKFDNWPIITDKKYRIYKFSYYRI